MVKKSNCSTEEQFMDENFGCLLRVAEAICGSLARPKDRYICSSTLESLIMFNTSSSMETKSNLRKFLRFYLVVLRWTQTHQPMEVYQKWYGNTSSQGQASSMKFQEGEMRHWLDPARSYLAMKHFDDGSTIIYSAMAKDPSSGWVVGGFRSLTNHT